MIGEYDKAQQYWRHNLRIIFIYLAICFAVSFGCGIVFVDYFNQYQLFGYKLGFWFASQGSILTFCALNIAYVLQMNRLDNKFNVHE
jgi:putative solute:sodium symporter small subunit